MASFCKFGLPGSFALLVHIGDEIANELILPFDRISLEMVVRGLYHFTLARKRGEASDPVKYLAAPEHQDLGVVKRIRKKSKPVPEFSPA